MSFTFKETEDKIAEYYRRLKILGGLRHKLEVYRKRKDDIQNKIDNSIIELSDDFSAVKYDMAGGGSLGFKSSPQERAVDKAFLILEKNLEEVNFKILLIEEQINNIEAENSDMEYTLKDIKPEYINILESLYKYNNGTLRTSMNYNMDKSTVSRKKDKAVREVMMWLNFYAWKNVQQKRNKLATRGIKNYVKILLSKGEKTFDGIR